MKALILSLCLATAILSWIPPPDADIAGYKVHHVSWFHWAIGDDNWYGIYDVGNITSAFLFWLPSGYLYNIFVTAYDFAGNDSVASKSIHFINRR